ncbi:hypothetical protein [Paraburkholderia terrae]|uniref:hypothetical protein n=1 Tax=Paraburkholderia terrae TaxID=311230 RepID=UPI001EE25DF2|nr:hypothetical protein [Paraburkholderia terrae]GJH07140.1 hypothetical protein CBA19C8_41305 [Paraburkholderia terrae]
MPDVTQETWKGHGVRIHAIPARFIKTACPLLTTGRNRFATSELETNDTIESDLQRRNAFRFLRKAATKAGTNDPRDKPSAVRSVGMLPS